MLCPLCKETLQISDRQGIEIDYCGKCRGVWLDRGELQKLIDLSIAQLSPAQPQPAQVVPQPIPAHAVPPVVPGQPQYQGQYAQHQYTQARPYDAGRYEEKRYDDKRYVDPRYGSEYGYGKPKKRESWFSELFDFD